MLMMMSGGNEKNAFAHHVIIIIRVEWNVAQVVTGFVTNRVVFMHWCRLRYYSPGLFGKNGK